MQTFEFKDLHNPYIFSDKGICFYPIFICFPGLIAQDTQGIDEYFHYYIYRSKVLLILATKLRKS